MIEFVGGPYDGRQQFYGLPLMDVLRIPTPTAKHPSITDEWKAGQEWMCEYRKGPSAAILTQYIFVRTYNPKAEREQ